MDDIFDTEKSSDNNTITIYAAYTKIVIDKRKKEVTILSTANEKYEEYRYGLYPLGSKIHAMDKKTSEESLKSILDNSRNEIEEIIYRLVYKLAHNGHELSTELSHYGKVLAEDKKFMETVERIYNDKHAGFGYGYKVLKKYDSK